MPPKKGTYVKSGAMSSKASPLPPKIKPEDMPQLTPLEMIQKELSRIGYKTPLTILNERSQKAGWERPNVDAKGHNGSFVPHITMRKHKTASQNSPIEELHWTPIPQISYPTTLEARHMGAVYALFRFLSVQPMSMVLPPYFRGYWTELLKLKAEAPAHRAWEFNPDPWVAAKEVSDRQVKAKQNEALRSGDNSASNSGKSTPTGINGTTISTGGGGLRGEWERAPEVKMVPSLRELVEETVKKMSALYPDAILQATRETDGPSNSGSISDSAPSVDFAKLIADLTEYGFRKAHIATISNLIKTALQRIASPQASSSKGIDPLVLALTTLSPQEAAIEWLVLHLPEDDLPKRFRPTRSVEEFVSSGSGGLRSGKAALMRTWIQDKLVKKVGYPRKVVEEIYARIEASSLPVSESACIDLLGKRLMGWEDDSAWGFEAALSIPDVNTEDRDERRTEELEAIESVFGAERFKVTSTEEEEVIAGKQIAISIPTTNNEYVNENLSLIVQFSPSSPYPSELHPVHPPTFYLESSTLPSYIRLYLHAQLLGLYRDEANSDLGSLVRSGQGGVIFGMVEWLELNWELALENPPSIAEVTKFLVPKPVMEEKEATVRTPAPRKRIRNGLQGPFKEATVEDHQRVREHWESWRSKPSFEKMLAGRMSLPAWKSQSDILNALDKNRVLVLVGETGSGKTTQTPQFILDHEISSMRGASANIIVTQPRRVSALGVAARVAAERMEDIDSKDGPGTVGYAIRGERRAGRDTKLLFCTTGVLLRRLSAGGDSDLKGCSHVIVDEVHERSVDGDFLLLELRELLKRNKTIKIILMSATINHQTFIDYFNGAPLLEISGRTFPVEDIYLEDCISKLTYRPSNQNYRGGGGGVQKLNEDQLKAMRSDYESRGLDSNSVSLLENITRSDNVDFNLVAAVAKFACEQEEGQGGILIFCSGVMEIRNCIDALRSTSLGAVDILPLHANLTSEEQKRVFLKTRNRKIVVATNIAETSITIDDITVVIDIGKVKENQHDPERNLQLLVEVFTSKAAARQRKGRAGRVSAGRCYKIYTRRVEATKMQSFPVPEILRTPLEALFLQVKAMREEEDVKKFLGQAISPPKIEAMDAAWKTLMDLGAVEGEHATSKLTALGRHMSLIPVDLRLAKMLILGSIFGCLDPVLSIAAILSSKPFFTSPVDKREEARRAREKFTTGNSDLLTDAKAYEECSKCYSWSDRRKFCEENFISQSTFRDVSTLRTDFANALEEIGFSARSSNSTINKNSTNENLVKSVVLGGLFPRCARVLLPKAQFGTVASGSVLKEHVAKEIKLFDQTERVFLHPGSVLFGEAKISSGFLAYFAKNQTTKVFLRDASEVPLYGLLLFGGKVTVNHFAGGLMVGDGWIKMKAWTRIGVLVNQLRRLLDAQLENQFEDPNSIQDNNPVILAMLALLARDGLAPP